jgi:hypothetical protein
LFSLRVYPNGLDFPFSLPRRLVEANNWEEFVLSFSSRYPDAEKFRQSCWGTAGNCEEKRDTDRKSKTPFSPYNRRLYRQTYYGIRDVLVPLVRDKVVSVLPMQGVASDKPRLLEVCPAYTLERMGQRRPYNTYYFILTSLPPDDYDTDTLSVSEVKYAEIRGKRHY